MAFVSRDGDAILGLGGFSLCNECGEASRDGDGTYEHAENCPKMVRLKARALQRQPLPRRDPNVYVMTGNGFEKAIDVERRRR